MQGVPMPETQIIFLHPVGAPILTHSELALLLLPHSVAGLDEGSNSNKVTNS
jgi:hypothetical protein